jgi:hypothetical protein
MKNKEIKIMKTSINMSKLIDKDFIIVSIISLVIAILFIYFINPITYYLTSNIATLVTEISGTFIGLTLASFAIIISLSSALRGTNLIKTSAFKGLGSLLIWLVLIEVITLASGLIFLLSENNYLTYVQITFLFLSTGFLILFAYYLKLLFDRLF